MLRLVLACLCHSSEGNQFVHYLILWTDKPSYLFVTEAVTKLKTGNMRVAWVQTYYLPVATIEQTGKERSIYQSYD